MRELWYILVTRHLETGDKKELHKGDWPGALECNSKEHALEVIAYLKKQSYKLALSELSEPTYEPVPFSLLGTVFPNRKIS